MNKSPHSGKQTDATTSGKSTSATRREANLVDPIANKFCSTLTEGELESFADDINLPVSTLKKAGSFYAENQWKNKESSVVQVCDGTSCRLGGGKTVEKMLRRYGHECEKVYCLGFCDRSPVSMIPYDQMREHTPTSLRNLAPEAIVTRRLDDGPVREIEAAIKAGVYTGLMEALKFPPMHLIEEVEKSGECSRGGADFSTGKKWRFAAESESDQKYVIANGDEGDPGSFLDRVLVEQDPHTIIEGMILCGYATGASEGIVYIRSEYPRAVEVMFEAITKAQREGYLGKDIFGSGFSFELRVFIGKGSYACGQEARLLRSLEGLQSDIRISHTSSGKAGLDGNPTVVNSIETLFRIPFIAEKGGEAYSFYGTHATSGTKSICLNHGFANPGIVEVEFGITFREVVEEIGGGGRDGEALAAVLVGGPMGTLLKPDDWDYPICFEVMDRHQIQLGHGGFIALPESTDFRDLLVHLTEFMIRESCKERISCQLGAKAFLKGIEENRPLPELEGMLDEIEAGSPGESEPFVPDPIRSLLADFSDRIFS